MIDISIVLPTRGRVQRLPSAIGSLVTRAANPKSLELLVQIDNDDEPSIQYFDGYFTAAHYNIIGAHTISCGHRVGYARLHEVYSKLALAAKGRFVLVWNDDTDMLTDEWDRLLVQVADAEPKRPLVQFIRRDVNGAADTTFPFLDKRIVDVLGGISRHMYTDTWIGEVAAQAGVLVFRNDVVFAHHWPMHDATQREGLEAVRQSGQHEAFRAMSAEKAEDVAKIKALLANLEGRE